MTRTTDAQHIKPHACENAYKAWEQMCLARSRWRKLSCASGLPRLKDSFSLLTSFAGCHEHCLPIAHGVKGRRAFTYCWNHISSLRAQMALRDE